LKQTKKRKKHFIHLQWHTNLERCYSSIPCLFQCAKYARFIVQKRSERWQIAPEPLKDDIAEVAETADVSEIFEIAAQAEEALEAEPEIITAEEIAPDAPAEEVCEIAAGQKKHQQQNQRLFQQKDALWPPGDELAGVCEIAAKAEET
jgi:hypothetical protein